MKDYNAIYNEKMQKLLQSTVGSEIADQLALKQITNSKLKEITDKISAITERPVWEDFSWKSGKILGILRSIAQNPLKRQELLAATGLDETIVEMYTKYCGNLPYLNSKDNTINIGRPMNIQMTKELLPIVALRLGVILDESDLDDITEERWNYLYENALKRAMETSEFNELNKTEEEYAE